MPVMGDFLVSTGGGMVSPFGGATTTPPVVPQVLQVLQQSLRWNNPLQKSRQRARKPPPQPQSLQPPPQPPPNRLQPLNQLKLQL